MCADGCTLANLCNHFLTAKRNLMEAGELSGRTFRAYYETCEALIDQLGKNRRVDDLRADDFESYRTKLAKKYGPTGLKNEINRCRILFKFAYDQRLIEHPVSYGQSFNRPSARMVRRARNERGRRIFDRDELQLILDTLDGVEVTTSRVNENPGEPEKVKLKRNPILKAMCLLGINGGLGNSDIASIPQSAIDLDKGWLEFPRPKTEIERRIPLWAETLDALREAIAVRPLPKDDSDDRLCFLTTSGNPWVRIKTTKQIDGTEKIVPLDALSQRFKKLLKSLEIDGQRGFYSLRHCFETIGGESQDQVAVDALIGHVDNSMAATYRHGVSDDRLQRVVDVVHNWLF